MLQQNMAEGSFYKTPCSLRVRVSP